MQFKQSIQRLLFGMILVCCFFWGIGQNSIAVAMPVSSEAMPTNQVSSAPPGFLQLEPAVDQYLMDIPDGYYTIGKVEGLKNMMATHQPLLVDVREPSEYRSGHIPGAMNIPLRSLGHNLSKIPTDRPVVLYCSTGYRSAMGVMTLHLLNYDNVQGFPPSFAGWKAAGEPIAQP